eukprot:scaffold2480_cov205-Alexandrium_tamarense.AAC.5
MQTVLAGIRKRRAHSRADLEVECTVDVSRYSIPAYATGEATFLGYSASIRVIGLFVETF